MPSIVPLTEPLAVDLARRLRTADRAEIAAAYGIAGALWRPKPWAKEVASLPGVALAVLDDAGEPVAMGGASIRGVPKGAAVTWFAGSDALEACRATVARAVVTVHRALLKAGFTSATALACPDNVLGWQMLTSLGYVPMGRPRCSASGMVFLTMFKEL